MGTVAPGRNQFATRRSEGLFFPIYIDPERRVIKEVGDPLSFKRRPDMRGAAKRQVAWPIRRNGSLGNCE